MALNRVQGVAIASCLFVILLIGMILMACSFSIILPRQCGLALNTVSNSIDDTRVYYEGRHFLGLGHKFIVYPMTWQVIDFSDDEEDGDNPLDAGSSDGQAITLEVTVFYSLIRSEIPALYRLLGTSFQGNLLSAAKSELKNTATKFSTEEYFKSRIAIASQMHANLQTVFRARHAHVEKVMLREIRFPASIEAQLLNKVLAEQTIKKNKFEQDERTYRAQTNVIIANLTRMANEILSAATASSSLIVKQAQADATLNFVSKQAQAWQGYRTALGLNNTELLRLQWLRSLTGLAPTARVLVGYDSLKGTVVPSP